MKTIKYLGLMLSALVSITGCTGDSGHLKTVPESNSRAVQQELIDNWSDYDIHFRSTAIIFDPKNDARKILLGGNWGAITSQESWTQYVKENMTGQGDFNPVLAAYPMTGVREIWGPDKQLYGFIIHQHMDSVNTQLVEVNTMRLWHSRKRIGGMR